MSLSTKGPRQPGRLYRWMMAPLGLFERWFHLTCRHFIRLASEKYERPLLWNERLRQGMHRAMCGICRLQERRMEQLRDLAHELAQAPCDEGHIELSAEATERMRRAMIDAAGKE